MKRWVLVLLVASLVANIFLLGLIGGSVWHWTHGRGMGFRGGWRTRLEHTLPQDKAEEMRRQIRETFRQSMPALREGRAARADAARLFVTPQFDANAINARLDQARASDMTLRSNMEHRMIQFASTLSQDQRKKMADVLKDGPFRQGPPHPPGSSGQPSGGPPPH